MGNYVLGKNHDHMKQRILYEAAKSFMEKGYTNTTMKFLAGAGNMSMGSLTNLFGTKEDILTELVKYVLEGQFAATSQLLEGMTRDKILFYAAETTLQLYITESDEHIRELYITAYSLPKSAELIQQVITGKLGDIFGELRPELQTTDFYKLEIASGGIIRSFMTVPCNIWFTMQQKVEAFLEASLLIYRVPDEKIREAISFVSGFHYPELTKKIIETMLERLMELKPEE